MHSSGDSWQELKGQLFTWVSSLNLPWTQPWSQESQTLAICLCILQSPHPACELDIPEPVTSFHDSKQNECMLRCVKVLGDTYILAFFSIGFGEGNGTPLQYSCLENPMDGGAL